MLAKELFTLIDKSTKQYNIISVIPGQGNFITYEDENSLEIGIPKHTYLSMFKQVHDLQPISLEEKYWQTLGYLITTNEHHTMLVLHREIVFQLIQEKPNVLAREVQYITSILTCRMSRINKSSSLWHWLKVLTILAVYINNSLSTYELIVKRAIKSCQLHFANYYACNFLRWIIRMNRIIDVPKEFEDIVRDLVMTQCKSCLSDCGLWGVLQVYLQEEEEGPSIDWIISDLYRIVNSLEVTIPTIKVRHTNHEQEAIDLLNWLIQVQCLVITPYVSLVEVISDNILLQIITKTRHTEVRRVLEQIYTKKKSHLELPH